MLTGQSDKVYYRLTLLERNAFIEIANKRAKKKRK